MDVHKEIFIKFPCEHQAQFKNKDVFGISTGLSVEEVTQL